MSSFQAYRILIGLLCGTDGSSTGEKFLAFLRSVEQSGPEEWNFILDGEEVPVPETFSPDAFHVIECSFSNIFPADFPDSVCALFEQADFSGAEDYAAFWMNADFGADCRLYGCAHRVPAEALPENADWEAEAGMELTLRLPAAKWAQLLECSEDEAADAAEELDYEIFPLLFGEENAAFFRLSEAEFDEAEPDGDAIAVQYWIPAWRIFYERTADEVSGCFDALAERMVQDGGSIRMRLTGSEEADGIAENRMFSSEGYFTLTFKSAENRIFDFTAEEITH